MKVGSPMQRLLIVDDEAYILSILRETLVAPDREFLLAMTGEEALRVANERGPLDVALIDKNLPGLSGIATTRLLKRMHPDMEVILLTGFASLDSAIEAIKVGAFDYFTKPIEDVSALRLKVQNAIEKTRLRREQRRLLAELRESEQRYRSVFEAGSDGLVICDGQTGLVEAANPAAQALYGYTAEEFQGLDAGELRTDDVVTLPGEGLRQETHRRKNSSAFQAEVVESRFSIGERAMRILAVRDISERVRAEQERRELEESLRHAQKMEAVGRLAGGIAHDFNNILTVIVTCADFLRMEVQEEKQQKDLDAILNAADRAAALTRQLLTFSRRQHPRHEVVSVNHVVKEMEDLFRRTIGENIDLVTSLTADAWQAQVDSDQLGQVLLNLVVNARDAMPQGGKLIIETKNLALDAAQARRQANLGPGEYICLSVTDTGVGMRREVMERIFEPFFTTKEQGKGTGLGLATVYGIVQQARGSVRVYSEPGFGTTFRIYLPRNESAVVKVTPPRAVLPPRGRGETILVAEDEDTVRSHIRRILSHNGYNVVEGRHGEEALAVARAHGGAIDLLLTDMVMPKMLGSDLAAALLQDRPSLRVMFMSGYSEYAIPEAQGEAMSFIQKPFTERQLLLQLRELLDLR
ncbi:MAG TPA: response regulator [Polyangia bacterium]|nr:response regulator [Polyangia bacterium]